ncbi:unnamed protein product, partial [marine sediment metagenome]
ESPKVTHRGEQLVGVFCEHFDKEDAGQNREYDPGKEDLPVHCLILKVVRPSQQIPDDHGNQE